MQTPDVYEEPLHLDPQAASSKEADYAWPFVYMQRMWVKGTIVTLLVIILSVAFYVWYNRPGNDVSPDGMVGLSFALAGTLCFVLAAVMYSVQRRLRKRAMGQLNAFLNWHVCFALLGVVFILMHSFGNFDPISGTYALYGLVALTLSGLVGRALDRVLPRLITGEVSKMLTTQGDDRVASVSQELETIVVHNTHKKLCSFPVNAPNSTPGQARAPGAETSHEARAPMTLHTPWDLAYFSLEPTQQELDRNAPNYRFIPNKKSALTLPDTLMQGAQEQMAALDELHAAMRREQLYRAIIRGWRVLHIFLSLLTVGLVIWHIIFALHILFPTAFHV